MINYILKKFGYFHFNEIKQILDDQAKEFENLLPYNPYKIGSEAWHVKQNENSHIAAEIRFLRLTFINRLK